MRGRGWRSSTEVATPDSELPLADQLTGLADRLDRARKAIPWGEDGAPASAWKDLTVAANRLRRLAESKPPWADGVLRLETTAEFELCPMGCGRTTDDVAGGPCSDCWDMAP